MNIEDDFGYRFNESCAKFLGWKFDGTFYYPNSNIKFLEEKYAVIQMNFCSSWDWIMEVCLSIESMPFSCEIKSHGCTIEMYEDSVPKDWMNCNFKTIHIWGGKVYKLSKKEAVVQAINQFLTWYNNEQRT